MENHKELRLSDLRRYIIRYGAKYMDAFESDLYYNCQGVENLEVGESVYWFVSEMHTYLYSAKDVAEHNLNIHTLWGDRFNYKITCDKMEFGEKLYSMNRQLSERNLMLEVNDYQGQIMKEFVENKKLEG